MTGDLRHGATLNEIRADVLVVGGGLAALRAAYDALGAGAHVVLAVKGKAGRSGSSAMTSAGYSSAVGETDSPERHYEDTITGGKGINDAALVRIVAEEAPEKLRELIALGAPLAVDTEGGYQINPSGDHSIARTVAAANHTGRDFTDPLTQAVIDRGCQILETTAIVELLVVDDQVVGAVGLEYERGELVLIAAPSVILGTGGAGRLFAVTSNPNDATGDGYALALRAGAPLRDMEFVQFYPYRCIIPFENSRMPIQPATFVLGGTLWNSDGERFMLRYDPVRAEYTTRDVAARGIYEQIRAGKDVRGGVRLDVSALSLDDWVRTNPRPAKHFIERGLDFHAEEMIIAPEAHFFMGGAAIDTDGQTPVRGLFAAGEAAGGVHGANRLDSNAIPETQVIGARAGRAAAARARSAVATAATMPADWKRRFASAIARPDADGSSPYPQLRKELQNVMWKYLGIVRDGDGMAQGLRDVEALAIRVAGLEPAGARELMHHATMQNSLLVARTCFSAALARRESRGAHYRSDHPAQDDASWLVSLHIALGSDGSLRLEPKPVRRDLATTARRE